MKSVRSLPVLPPTALVLLSIVSTQLGSALAKSLFQQLNPYSMALLRVGFAAIVLLLLWRPRLTGMSRRGRVALIGFGLSLSLMNLTFYLAIERIPIGVAVALEFIGPLGVAVANSRRWLDGLWVALAAVGIGLLAPIGGSVLDPVGVGLALVAGSFWAAYILLSARVGRAFPGGTGLALAMSVGAIVLLPIGLMAGGTALVSPPLLLLGFGVALLSSALPYSFELEALRWLPVRVFGVLLSLEPVAAAVIGLVLLGETLDLRASLAIGLVTVAAAGASRFGTRT
ncbi:MAG: EamA family transporter [Synechococcales cyanobacterium C42_A2020_086]|jgi:inner membrane transporter RhtA|nr:EamA family transporter [Synechococcales cyanobacterium M58_A2018_015]MBF2072630.1 EamA family transporter [Synechococcales cyanobacterium C42_A2020_086]